MLPAGVQSGSRIEELVEEVNRGEEWEGVSVEEFAMALVTESAEGIMPSFDEAKRRPDWPKWQMAISEELDNLEQNGTWELVKCPKDTNVVNSKWVLQIKKNAAGEIEKYKARLVARGFTQVYGVDYYKTYTPVAKLSTFQLILAITARNGWSIDSFDFNSTYLNSVLQGETIYLKQPPDHATKPRNKWVCQLIKTIYGLKQGVKNWYNALCEALRAVGFKRSEANHGLFFKEEDNHLVILVIHVDNCLITGSLTSLIKKAKDDLSQHYSLTDLGSANWLWASKSHKISLSITYHFLNMPTSSRS